MKWTGHDIFARQAAGQDLGIRLPRPAFSEAVSLFSSPLGWRYFSIILPMGLFNLIGSLQNLESAEAAGDRYEPRPSLLVNGLGTLVAAFFGSPFPPTIYIGHPGWKAMGARAGYSILNGTVISLLCLAGGVGLVLRVVPVEATLGILLWIGIIITAQAFQEVPRKHALAVALGLVPSLAAWALVLVETALRAAGSNLAAALPKFGDNLYIEGVIALSQGFVLTSMLLSAALAFMIDRAFLKAAGWIFASAVFSALGLIHAYRVGPAGVENVFGWMAAPSFAAAYFIGGCGMLGFHFFARNDGSTPASSTPAK
jgi:AGZA family xanthine/uracil permease-like MFS transporter